MPPIPLQKNAMEKISFEQLPAAVCELCNRLERIEQILVKRNETSSSEIEDRFLTIQEAAEFLKLTVQTLYSKVSRRELPFMKRSKRLYFSQNELTEYLKSGFRKSNSEIQGVAKDYVSERR